MPWWQPDIPAVIELLHMLLAPYPAHLVDSCLNIAGVCSGHSLQCHTVLAAHGHIANLRRHNNPTLSRLRPLWHQAPCFPLCSSPDPLTMTVRVGRLRVW
jgi:hypothetical protein